ncbi:DNA modification methylase [Microbacterium marinilacus]|uniref:DNA modification methylase n=1 Tax=Microbacterium marinilacus TaxID=415209 RepID=A0ABP7BDP6_9MICO|nr:DNA modification methylase [Microbacterium marinilacus]MBY0688979.1 DNA modification methylase [Microbacterium marinilacus]
MNSRILASLALGAVIALGATGCASITHQATTIAYSPSDGVNVPNTDGAAIEVRNAVVVADDEGTDGNLVAALVNTTDAPATLNLEWGSETATVRVPAGEVVSLGAGTEDPLMLEGIDTPAGATLPVYFQSGDGEGVLTEVPVLDGCMEHFASLVPGGESSDCSHLEKAEEEEAGH